MQMVKYLLQFSIVMTSICGELVSATYANRFISSKLSHIQYTFVFFLFFIWKMTPLNNLKIMKKSLIIEYDDVLENEM